MAKKKRARRGEGKVYRRGGLYAVRWTENGARHYSGGYLTEDDADQVRASIAANIQAGRPGMKEQPKAPQQTFGALVEEWLEDRTAKGRRTVEDDRRRWDRHLAPALAHRTPGSVDAGFLDRLITNLRNPPIGTLDPDGEPKKGVKPATAQRIVHLLSAFYRWLGKHHGVAVNPIHGLTGDEDVRSLLKSTHDPKSTPYLKKKADIERIHAALPEPVAIAFYIGAKAGLRPGEVLALEWNDIDLDADKIHVQRQVRHGRVGVPKSGKSRDDVPITPKLHAALKAWRSKNPKATIVIPPKRQNTKARFLNWRTIKDAMTTALDKLKIKPAGMTFYQATRHTFASQWVIAGNSIYKLSTILGHSTVKVTERYAHLAGQKAAKEELARVD
jgi:integrase